MHARSLNIRFDTRDPGASKLPVIAELAATNGAAGVDASGSCDGIEAGRAIENSADEVIACAVEAVTRIGGIISAPPITGVRADVKTGPAVDGRRRNRSFDRHVGS